MSASAPASLYVIPGSHACAAAELMLAHKQLPFKTVAFLPGLHPVAVRLAGFSPARGERRRVAGRSTPMLAAADMLGTVPALRLGSERVMGNPGIARLLDRTLPEPPLLPADPAERAQVEELERWGGGELQMTARRLALVAGPSGHMLGDGDGGRLGALLYRRAPVRRAASRLFGVTFAASAGDEEALLGQARAMLDRVDQLIGEGRLNGAEPTVADFMVAPSVALMEYHEELAPEIASRPVHALLERLMPAGGA